MPYQPKNFEYLLGLQGFSEAILKNHFTLYQGYVNNFNKLNDTLVAMEREGNFSSPQYAELNRRLGWEFNGMRLHEYYFENINKEVKEIDKNSELSGKINKEFGSFEMFEKDFKSMGLMRGIGWVILYYDILADRLFNVWINEHDAGHFAGAKPLLIMDVFEHSYMIDYGLKKADYIEAFFKLIDWDIAGNRLKK
ncbi:MAG: Fe-Mn family superoxide dismutase [Patescibacteria group bacterium]